tara:strand:- start:686 stop:1216 length:531 start_codon:yes stop_codon:yes gene_type:complete
MSMNQPTSFSVVSNCPLCEQHSLHVMGEGHLQTQQCINCGFASAEKFKGFQDDKNDGYQTLSAEMKKWSKYANGRVWIPSIITLPFGMLYPVDIDNPVTHKVEMRWAWADMVDIYDSEKENYPDPNGGYYEKRIDIDNRMLLDSYLEGMSYINEKSKELNSQEQPSKLTLPKLKKK